LGQGPFKNIKLCEFKKVIRNLETCINRIENVTAVESDPLDTILLEDLKSYYEKTKQEYKRRVDVEREELAKEGKTLRGVLPPTYIPMRVAEINGVNCMIVDLSSCYANEVFTAAKKAEKMSKIWVHGDDMLLGKFKKKKWKLNPTRILLGES